MFSFHPWNSFFSSSEIPNSYVICDFGKSFPHGQGLMYMLVTINSTICGNNYRCPLQAVCLRNNRCMANTGSGTTVPEK